MKLASDLTEKGRDLFPSKIFDLIRASERNNKSVFSEFLTSVEQYEAEKILWEQGIFFKFYGGYPDADRKMLCIPSPCENDALFPFIWLCISVSDKFTQLNHSDYMGAVMALGVERSVFGDIVVQGHCAYIPILCDFENYFISNLESVGKASCVVRAMPDGFEPDSVKKFIEFTIIISSDRLDCYVAALTSVSREKCCGYIKSGLVSVNYKTCQDNNRKLTEGDIVVIRGSGKFIIGQTNGITRKDRLKINVKKYI